MIEKGPRKYTPQQGLIAMQKYCSMQERCHEDVRRNLIKHQVYGEDIDDIILSLIQDNFLNEERFAIAFVRGKFKMKKWGRLKIKQALKFKKISAYCIKKGFEEIDEQDYQTTLTILLEKKYAILTNRGFDDFTCLKKMSTYAVSKGYETHLVYSVAKAIVFDK